MEASLMVLREKGYKITPQRRAVIQALAACGKFSTAQQVMAGVKKTQPDVSLDTIYRNLTLLAELGIVHEIHRHTGDLYELVVPGDHHHHFVCTQCGQAECIDFCPLASVYTEAAERSEFMITGHIFEIYGLCKNCRRKDENS